MGASTQLSYIAMKMFAFTDANCTVLVFFFSQQVWLKSDYNIICENISSVLPHNHYFYRYDFLIHEETVIIAFSNDRVIVNAEESVF